METSAKVEKSEQKGFADHLEAFKNPDRKDLRFFHAQQREALMGMEKTAQTIEDYTALYRTAVGDIWEPLYLSTCARSVQPILDFELAERVLQKIKELGGTEPPRK